MIEKVENHEISRKEMQWLLQSVEQAGESKDVLIARLITGEATCWRIRTRHGVGIMVTLIQDGMLFIWYFAGENLWKDAKTLLQEVKDFTRKHGLKGVSAVIIPALKRFLVSQGFKSSTYVEWRA